MPRKPNYRFDRQERERAKAKKKAERLQAKADRKAGNEPPDTSVDEPNSESSTENPLSKSSE